MKQRISRLIVFIGVTYILLLACGRGKKQVESPISAEVIETETPEVLPGTCYLAVSENDSILMNIVIENNSVAGYLHYRFYEKDKSGGKVFGAMRGDTLVADYKFISEGMESEREVAFLKVGNDFIEGHGELVDQDGRMVFKKLSSLTFDGLPMLPWDCTTLTKYFKK